MEINAILPSVICMVRDYNRDYPNECLGVTEQQKDVFVLRFYYWDKPSEIQLQRLRELFATVEVVDMDDEDCGTLYPIFVTLKP